MAVRVGDIIVIVIVLLFLWELHRIRRSLESIANNVADVRNGYELERLPHAEKKDATVSSS